MVDVPGIVLPLLLRKPFSICGTVRGQSGPRSSLLLVWHWLPFGWMSMFFRVFLEDFDVSENTILNSQLFSEHFEQVTKSIFMGLDQCAFPCLSSCCLC